MDNFAPCKSVGQETVQIYSHSRSITMFSYVCNVSESRFNLISLGALDSEWFTFNAENSCLEVSKSVYIKLKAKKIDNLYEL